MALESKAERIAARLEAILAAIRGDGGATYFYTVDLVARVDHFADDQLSNDRPATVYLLRAGDETLSEGTTGFNLAEAEFFLIVAQRYGNTDAPVGSKNLRQQLTIQNRLIRDALKALLADVKLGDDPAEPGSQFAVNVSLGSLLVDRGLVLKGWTLAELRFTTQYTWKHTAP
jgi:hypothetical protein